MDNNNYLYIGIPTSNDPGVMRPSGTLTVNPAGVLSLGVPAKRNGKYVLVGGVKPDGTTITVDSDGTIHGASQGLDFDSLSAALWILRISSGMENR